jgi:hypothetical protein
VAFAIRRIYCCSLIVALRLSGTAWLVRIHVQSDLVKCNGKCNRTQAVYPLRKQSRATWLNDLTWPFCL